MRKCWTDDELGTLKRLYPNTRCKDIARLLNSGTTSIYRMANKLKLHKNDEFKKSELSGRITKALIKGAEYRFDKGHKPFNKGLTMNNFMSQENQDKFLRNAYKKGHLPHNTKKDGEISIRKDKFGYIFKYIRLSICNWKVLHVYNWEQENGQVPEGFIVVFRTPDRMNCDTSNLELITRRENMLRNSIQRYPEDLQLTMKTLKKLTREINGQK